MCKIFVISHWQYQSVWWYVCLHEPSHSAAFLLGLIFWPALAPPLAKEIFQTCSLCQHLPLNNVLQYSYRNVYTCIPNMLLTSYAVHVYLFHLDLTCACAQLCLHQSIGFAYMIVVLLQITQSECLRSAPYIICTTTYTNSYTTFKVLCIDVHVSIQLW